MKELILFTLIFLGFIALLLGCEWLFKRYNLKPDDSRKIAHASCGTASLSFVWIFDSAISVIALSFIFSVLLYAAKRHKKLQSINGVRRDTSGAYLLPVAIGVAFGIFIWKDSVLLYLIPIAVISISDPLAAMVGEYAKRWAGIQNIRKKTIFGSFAFFISALSICLVLLNIFYSGPFNFALIALCIAMVTCIAEYHSNHGYDNITVPIAAIGILLFC